MSQPATKHLIGLLPGAEEDWLRAFEEIPRACCPVSTTSSASHLSSAERKLDGWDW